jgi:hypothetical protein
MVELVEEHEDIEEIIGQKEDDFGIWKRAEIFSRQNTDIADLRFGLNRGRPTTVIPKAVKPSNKKGVKT